MLIAKHLSTLLPTSPPTLPHIPLYVVSSSNLPNFCPYRGNCILVPTLCTLRSHSFHTTSSIGLGNPNNITCSVSLTLSHRPAFCTQFLLHSILLSNCSWHTWRSPSETRDSLHSRAAHCVLLLGPTLVLADFCPRLSYA